MPNEGLDLLTSGEPAPRRAGSRRADTRRRGPRWGRLLLVLVVLVGLAYGGYRGVEVVRDALGGPEDYSGSGTGEVVVEIPSGATGQDIARILADADVVASSEAFYQLALRDSRASTITAGAYSLKRKMSAEAALTALTDTAVRVEGRVVVPEGARIDSIVARIVENTDIPEADLRAALADPAAIGLPAVAGGNPEGYLYPATYTVVPGTTAADLLSQMVAKTIEVSNSLDIETRAAALGLTTEQVLTVASILEYEAKQDADYPKVARVLYNRLAIGMRLQLDSTVSYISGRQGDVFTTAEERATDSPYNTYLNTGLPPGPIGSPGEKTIEAALKPADGDWLYFVAVNLETGETLFADTKAEHDRNVETLREYCRSSDLC